jgi:hypothetical protein
MGYNIIVSWLDMNSTAILKLEEFQAILANLTGTAQEVAD